MTVNTFLQPDAGTQTGSTYKGAIDKSVAVLAEIGRLFAPHESNPPALTVTVDAGRMLVDGALVLQSAQSVTGFVATGANQRIDRVVIDVQTGAASRVAGTQSGSPVAPAIPSDKLPCCQVGPFTTSTTAIGNGMITDERITARGRPTGWVLLDKKTASASAQIDFTTGIDGTYNEYMITFTDVIPATDITQLWMRFSQDGGGTFKAGATDYKWILHGYESGAPNQVLTAAPTGTTHLELAHDLGLTSGESCSGVVEFSNPAGTSKYKPVGSRARSINSNSLAQVTVMGGAMTLNTAAVNAVRIMMSTGNITSGEFALYGLRK